MLIEQRWQHKRYIKSECFTFTKLISLGLFASSWILTPQISSGRKSRHIFIFFEYVGELRIIILRREDPKKTKTDYKKQGTQQTQKRQKKRKENEEGNTRKKSKNTD